MPIALLLAAGLAWWLHRRGELIPNLARWAGTGAAILLALRLLEVKPLLALGVGAAGLGWWWLQRPRAAGAAAARDSQQEEAAALKLLGLKPDADIVAIQAAWRARIAAAHPDAGGSDAAASAVTAARDLLLARRAAKG